LNTRAFIATHLEEQAQSLKVVLATWGIITIIARALDFDGQVSSSLTLCSPECIDVVTYINMKLFQPINGGQLWLNRHGQPLFPLPA